MEGDNSVKT